MNHRQSGLAWQVKSTKDACCHCFSHIAGTDNDHCKTTDSIWGETDLTSVNIIHINLGLRNCSLQGAQYADKQKKVQETAADFLLATVTAAEYSGEPEAFLKTLVTSDDNYVNFCASEQPSKAKVSKRISTTICLVQDWPRKS